MRRYRIRITSGLYTGHFVGSNSGGGLMTDPELLGNREFKVPRTNYSLYAQTHLAGVFLQRSAKNVQAQLKNLGYESELVEVGPLDSLVGLSLSAQNIEQRILRACQIKLKDPGTDRVCLLFAGDHGVNDVTIEKDTTVEILREALALVRSRGYDRISGFKCLTPD
jgi:hypothetical protein